MRTHSKQSTYKKYQGILLLQIIEADWLADGPPYLKLPVKGVNSLLIYLVNETPFETVNL